MVVQKPLPEEAKIEYATKSRKHQIPQRKNTVYLKTLEGFSALEFWWQENENWICYRITETPKF